VQKNERAAVEWYRKAADQGHAYAQNNLGLMYANGQGGLLQRHTEAARLYRHAAIQGHAFGQRNLARLTRDGSGVKANRVEAHAWFNLANTGDDPHPDVARERDALARQLNQKQLAEAQRLASEWRVGQPMGRSRVP
jgi:hypothetical protein